MEISHAAGGMPAGGASAPAPAPAPAPDAHPALPPVQGSFGTVMSLVLRTISLGAAAMSIVGMCSADDYQTIPAFSFLIGAAAVQSAWSLGMAALDIDLLLLSKGSRKHWFLQCIKFIDSIVGGTVFSGASASCGVYLFMRYDVKECATEHCAAFESAITRAYVAFAAIGTCCLANWLNSWRTSDQAMKIPTEWAIYILLYSVAFASPSIAMGAILSCLVDPDDQCTITMPSLLLLLALILQISEGTLELFGYALAGVFGPTNPGPTPDWPLTCFIFVAVKSLIAVFTLGSGCATLGLQHAFFINDIYKKSTNILIGMFCLTSLVTGVLSVLSSSFSVHLFASRYLRRGRGQQ